MPRAKAVRLLSLLALPASGRSFLVVLQPPCGYIQITEQQIEVTDMLCNYTAKYTRLAAGYMGQLVEWPEVVTEGRDLEDCRTMLRDALHEMVLAYQEQGKEIPSGNALIEQLPVEIDHVRQTA